MALLRNIADRLIGLSAALASLALVFVVVVIFADVIARETGNALRGAQDVTTMAMVILVFGGMALCDRRGGHIAVDVFERRFPDRMNHIVDILSALLGAAIFLGIAWAVWESSKISQMLNLSTNLIRLPKAWFQWALSIFAVVTALGMILRAAELSLTGRDVRPERQDDPE